MTRLLTALFLVLPFFAYAQSFDCAKATTTAEKQICSDKELGKLDVDLADYYQLILRNTNDPQALRNEQNEWLKQRDSSADLKNLYIARVAELEKKFLNIASKDFKNPVDMTIHIVFKNKDDICNADLTGYNVNVADSSGKSLLMLVAMGIDEQYDRKGDCLVRNIVEAGANVDAKDNSGKTAMDYTPMRYLKLYLRGHSKLPVVYTDLPATDELYRERYGEDNPVAEDNQGMIYMKQYRLTTGKPYPGAEYPIEDFSKRGTSFYNPDNSQFCRDIAADKIAFKDENTASGYRLDIEYGGSARMPSLIATRLADNSSKYVDPIVWPSDYNIMTYNGELYVEEYDDSYRNYFKFRPDLVAFEPVCQLYPTNPTFTATKPSDTCNQVIAGDYKKLEPQTMKTHILKDYSENAKFIRDYNNHCAENNMNSACNYHYLLADYNNDKTTNILVSEKHIFSGGRGCVLDYLNVYDEGKFLLITTGVEEQYLYGGNTHNDYWISCEGGTQELVNMAGTNYLLTKSQHGIDALHKVFTRADGLNDVEEVCKFEVKYEYH